VADASEYGARSDVLPVHRRAQHSLCLYLDHLFPHWSRCTFRCQLPCPATLPSDCLMERRCSKDCQHEAYETPPRWPVGVCNDQTSPAVSKTGRGLVQWSPAAGKQHKKRHVCLTGAAKQGPMATVETPGFGCCLPTAAAAVCSAIGGGCSVQLHSRFVDQCLGVPRDSPHALQLLPSSWTEAAGTMCTRCRRAWNAPQAMR